MTPDCLRALLDQIGWSQRELARRLDYDDRQVRRWAAGASPIPPPVAAWLAEIADLLARVAAPGR